MNKVLSVLLAAAAAAVISSGVRADDLTGVDRILCSAVQATRCSPDGDCEIGPSWNYNIPQFIEIDLREKTLRTTKASGENRSTPIQSLKRDESWIILQGEERGRAFSFVIEVDTGMASVAVAAKGQAVAIFGACTALPGSK